MLRLTSAPQGLVFVSGNITVVASLAFRPLHGRRAIYLEENRTEERRYSLHVSLASSQGFVGQMSRCSLYSMIAGNRVCTCVWGSAIIQTSGTVTPPLSFFSWYISLQKCERSPKEVRILPASRSNTILNQTSCPMPINSASREDIPRLYTTGMYEDIQRGS